MPTCLACGRNPASRSLSADLAGRVVRLELCPACAEGLGINPPDSELPLLAADLLAGLLGGPAGSAADDRACPVCATRFRAIRRGGRVGCMRCFEAFGPEIRRRLRRLGGAPVHAGALPGRLAVWRQVLADGAASPSSGIDAAEAFAEDVPAVPGPALPRGRAILAELLPAAEAWRGPGLDNDPACLGRSLVMYRNAMDLAFPARLTKAEAVRLLAGAERFFRTGPGSALADGSGWTSAPAAGPVQRSFRNGDGSLDCELNGTDHFRLRHHGFGPDWQAGFQRLHRLEAALEQVFPFAVNLEWGHLSASLANLGTALRAETWLHLPLAGGPDALAGAAGLPLAEGLALEATALPSVWRLSNRRTLGWGESEMISRLAAGARLLLHYTQAMARQARGREPADLEDRAWRCWGSLRHGRLLDRAELGAGLDRLRRGLLDGSFRGDGSDGGPAHWQISCLLVLLLAGAAPADGPGLAALVRRILETA